MSGLWGVTRQSVCITPMHTVTEFCALVSTLAEPLFCPHREAHLSWWASHAPNYSSSSPPSSKNFSVASPMAPEDIGLTPQETGVGNVPPNYTQIQFLPRQRGAGEASKDARVSMCPHLCREWLLNSLCLPASGQALCCELAFLPSIDATSMGKSHLRLTSFHPFAALLNSKVFHVNLKANRIPQVMYTYIYIWLNK